jgi:hypothetical protein
MIFQPPQRHREDQDFCLVKGALSILSVLSAPQERFRES